MLTSIGEIKVRNEDDRRVISEVIDGMCYLRWGDIQIRGTVLDCGGHIGAFTKQALFMGAKKVITVEPHPENFALLKENVQDNRVTFINKAITTKPYIFLNGERNDLYKISNKGIKIKGISLNDLIKEPIDLLKMDIEGAEYDAFYSCSKLNLVSQITMEYHNGGTAMAELVIYLESKGFKLSWIGGQEWGLLQMKR